jgi:hypothetical protein
VVQSSRFELVINAETARTFDPLCRRHCSPLPTRCSNNLLFVHLLTTGYGPNAKSRPRWAMSEFGGEPDSW